MKNVLGGRWGWCHAQDLSEDLKPCRRRPLFGKLWRHGRAWWHFTDPETTEPLSRWFGGLDIEWTLFVNPSFRLEFSRGGYNDEAFTFSVALLLFHLHVGIEGAKWKSRKWRECGVYWHEWGLWIQPWVEGMGDWHRDMPWWAKTHNIDFWRLLMGKGTYAYEKGEPVEILIPMPEGCYRATARPYVQSWRWRFGYGRENRGFDIEIPGGGIPFEGKGENSWDCGEDGLCGIGLAGTLEECIGKTVASVLASRKRYGNVARVVQRGAVMAPVAGD
jgi:hypothetical protein